jgi:hypothetical protein
MDNREILLNHKALTKEHYPVDYTSPIIDHLVTSPHLNCRLDWDNKFCSLDYIDNISPEDLKSPIMWGIDNSHRLFIAIRTRMNDNPRLVVETFFQRYTYGKKWVSGEQLPHRITGYSNVEVVHCSMADEKTSAYQNFLNLLLKGYTEIERISDSPDEIIRCKLTVM